MVLLIISSTYVWNVANMQWKQHFFPFKSIKAKQMPVFVDIVDFIPRLFISQFQFLMVILQAFVPFPWQ